ncbi:MAG: segregation/condensation protein A [Myxococcales bacterium]|nr:segregation/condensation protein A [Myxococcales bacterium]
MSASVTPAGAAPAPEGAPEFSNGAYAVKLSVFEGPLDLLLHLIRINEVDITDIPVARIAKQYLEYLDLMRELNLDVAGEYLVMSATLAWIKSRMLLPAETGEAGEEGIDPRGELVARLLEYQRFKEAAEGLGERPLLGRDVYPACGFEIEPPPDAEREIEVGIFQLVEAFRQALRHAGPSAAAHEVEIETVTVRDQMLRVMELLGKREMCEFEEFVVANGSWVSRAVIVATFLAILELARLEALGLYQGVNEMGVPEGPIHVRRVGEAGSEGWAKRISELM